MFTEISRLLHLTSSSRYTTSARLLILLYFLNVQQFNNFLFISAAFFVWLYSLFWTFHGLQRKNDSLLQNSFLLPPSLSARHQMPFSLFPISLSASKKTYFPAMNGTLYSEPARQQRFLARTHSLLTLALRLHTYRALLPSLRANTHFLSLPFSFILERRLKALQLRPFVRPSLKQILTAGHALALFGKKRLVTQKLWTSARKPSVAFKSSASGNYNSESFGISLWYTGDAGFRSQS